MALVFSNLIKFDEKLLTGEITPLSATTFGIIFSASLVFSIVNNPLN